MDFLSWQTATGINPALYKKEADHLRIGERVKVILINRATGYIGTATTQVGNVDEGKIDFPIDKIVMRPPNLKIKAERQFKVEQGMNLGQDRNYLIGFEGSGLKSDDAILITTEWWDHDGTPLPKDLTGYTGRFAKITGNKKIGNLISEFDIKTGVNMVIVKLGGDITTSNDHFYIHVNGEPTDRNPNFTTLGAGSGILAQRPQHYVPVRVPIYDEVETIRRANELRAALKDGLIPFTSLGTEPVYRWPYRSEMQFTLYDLKVKEINRKQNQLEYDPLTQTYTPVVFTENVYAKKQRYVGCEDYASLLDCMRDGTDAVEILYSLKDPALSPLDPFGPGQELIFSEVGAESAATIGVDQVVRFDNRDYLKKIDVVGFLGISLFQNNDAANILWEFAYIKNDECGEGCDPNAIPLLVANPVNPYTGNKYESETDYSGPQGLRFTRYYNSQEQIDTEPSLGIGWSHSYSGRLIADDSLGAYEIRMVRPDGRLDTLYPVFPPVPLGSTPENVFPIYHFSKNDNSMTLRPTSEGTL